MNRDKLIIILGGTLFISLACNLFAAGLWLGSSYNPHKPAASETPADARRAEWKKKDEELRKQLAPPDREILKAAMQEHRPQFQTLRQDLEAAHQKVADAQNAEPFDQNALNTALHNESDKKAALLQTMRQARDDIAQKLSPEGRIIFNKLAPGRFGGGGGGPGPGPAGGAGHGEGPGDAPGDGPGNGEPPPHLPGNESPDNGGPDRPAPQP